MRKKQHTSAGFVNEDRGAYRSAHGPDSLVTGNVRPSSDPRPSVALHSPPWNVLARRQSRTHLLRMPSQVHSCLADALYHLLVQAVNVRICINAVRAIMLFEGDTPIEIVEAFATGYSCNLTRCTESFTHGKKGGPELHLLKQEEGFYLVLLDVYLHDGAIDRHAVAYDGSHVLDNGKCASLASPPAPRLSRTARLSHGAPLGLVQA